MLASSFPRVRLAHKENPGQRPTRYTALAAARKNALPRVRPGRSPLRLPAAGGQPQQTVFLALLADLPIGITHRLPITRYGG